MCVWPASTTGRAGDLAIEAEGVIKRFGKVEALSGLDLVAQRGQVTAVLGPNGAGKTTLVRAIATLIRPQAGTL
jgi:ABC-2 type transport system ATP-binding protein